ncbi:hypothetical protein COCNU_scaffold004461G000020 [Cocos nucifera]|nr:hypothetical protein [Cocos nucifera]
MTPKEWNPLSKKIKFLKRKDGSIREPSKMAHAIEVSLAVQIQTIPLLDMTTVAPSTTLPDEVIAPMPSEQEEVAEKKKKAVNKKVSRKVGRSGGENFGQGQASLDDWEVVHSLIEGSILPHIIDKIVWIENAERFDDSFATYLERGHYLFAHSKAVNLCQAKASRAL